jgi:O-antigen ligase
MATTHVELAGTAFTRADTTSPWGPPIAAFWLSAWSVALSIGWLLPNHYPPWSSFYLDFWSAAGLLLVSAPIIFRSQIKVQWSGLTLLVAAVTLVPALQYGLGLITHAGNAWVDIAYLLGFLMALVVGARWEAAASGQLADGLFLAVGIASLFSVGLELHQWLRLDRLDTWSMGGGVVRPFANFGQPNQLATFLLWGLLATLWGLIRKHVGGRTAVGVALYLLFGLALTASRTAWLAVGLIVVTAWFWRRIWPDQRVPLAMTWLSLYFVLCTIAIGPLSQIIFGGVPSEMGDLTRMSGESRPAIWAMFLDAVRQRPLWGYGWNQVTLAQIAVSDAHPLQTVYAHSHNLFLDLVLWCGVPLGGLVSAWLIWWFWRRIQKIPSPENATLILFLIVVGNHAMLELPLHYAYFLLPVGMVMGALEVRLGVHPVILSARWLLAVLWLMSAILIGLIFRDYRQVEIQYQTLRFEWAHIRTAAIAPPNLLLLTQWRDFFRLARFDPPAGMSAADLQSMRDVSGLYPSGIFIQRLATALALNHQPREAALWLRRLCEVGGELQCAAVKKAWVRQAHSSPEIAAVSWPN